MSVPSSDSSSCWRIGRGARRLVAAGIWFVFTCLVGSRARADVSSVSLATAETLFREGKALLAKQDYAAACPKLVESQRLDPGTGTLLAVAICHEGEGKFATAWVEFKQALAEAKTAGRTDRVNLAAERIAALEPKLSRLAIRIGAARIDGLKVYWDDELVASAAFDSPIPIDPGEHVITATAPGKEPWTTTVSVGRAARVYDVTIPALANKKPSDDVTPAPQEDDVELRTSGGRIAAYVVGGIGVGVVAAGAVFGLGAFSRSNDAKALCPTNVCTDPSAIERNESAKTSAMISNVLVGAGAALVATGVAFWLLFPGKTAAKVRAAMIPGGGVLGYASAF